MHTTRERAYKWMKASKPSGSCAKEKKVRIYADVDKMDYIVLQNIYFSVPMCRMAVIVFETMT